MRGHSLVTAVPLPGVARPAGEEVGRALVLDSLGEPQQHAGVVVSGVASVGRAAGTHQRKITLGHNDITKVVFVFLLHLLPCSGAESRLCANKWWVEKKGKFGCTWLFGFRFQCVYCSGFLFSGQAIIKLLHKSTTPPLCTISGRTQLIPPPLMIPHGQPSPTDTWGGCYGSKLSESHSHLAAHPTFFCLCSSPWIKPDSTMSLYLDKQFSSAAHLRLYMGTLWT